MNDASRWFLFLSLLVSMGCGPSETAPLVDQADPKTTLEAPADNDPAINAPATPDDASPKTGKAPVVNQPPSTGKTEFAMLSWNVESEGADSDVIATQLTALNVDGQYDVFALTEVMASDFVKFRDAAGKNYKHVFSKSGHNDRLELIYNADKFELVRHFEIKEVNILNRYRAPLVAHLKERTSGIELLVMVNHLARGKAEIREQQATMLVDWARDQTLPVFALGDYNFDFVFATRKGNPGFENMMRDNIWRWVEPSESIDTNWYDNPREPDGKDDYPGSILDFAFVAGSAKDWTSVCNVIVREGDFPDDKTTSDHRPFELIISK